ncbi:MAG: hypothetical protein LLF28_08025 [Nitrospiraceae bacterium]|nr:hypothetical protein [Nitrospiraceae bacterium]
MREKDMQRDMKRALTTGEEEIKKLACHPSPKVIANILQNKNLTDDIVLIIANRKNITSEILERLANDLRWKENPKIILALCKNPKTPQRIALSLIKSLRIFDLAEIARNKTVPINLRIKTEALINERIPAMSLGIKKSLAKMASSNVLMKLIQEGLKDVASICLDSPYMTEAVLYKIINMERISPQVIRLIAGHKRWTCSYEIKWALIRNPNTPLVYAVDFLKKLKKTDLKELYYAPEVPSSTKPHIYRELLERGEIEIK